MGSRDPSRLGSFDDLGAVAARGHRVGSRNGARHGGREQSDDRGRDKPPPGPPSLLVRQRPAQCDREHQDDDECADDRQHTEDLPVGDAIRAQSDVLRERGARERPRADSSRGQGGREEQQPALHALARQRKPQHEHADSDDEACARQREHERERGDVDEQAPRDANGAPVLSGRPDPEAEDECDVGEERERVPVADRLAQAGDTISVRIERGHNLREQRPRQRRSEHEREHRGGESGRDYAAHGGEYEAEGEERDVGNRLVERLPAPVGDDRPPDRCPRPCNEEHHRGQEHASRPTRARQREPPERDAQNCGREQDDGRPADRKRARVLRRVAGESRPQQRCTDEHRDEESSGCGCPARRLRRRDHDRPR